MTRVLFCLALAALAVHARANVPEWPNVLFVAVDDLNDWVGCLGGHPQAHTPNIDRLAKRGVLFTNAHCASPACNPSRAIVFSGTMPWKTGVWSNKSKKLFQQHPDTRCHGRLASGRTRARSCFSSIPTYRSFRGRSAMPDTSRLEQES